MSRRAIAVLLGLFAISRRRMAGGPQGQGASAQAAPLAPPRIPAMAPTAGHEGRLRGRCAGRGGVRLQSFTQGRTGTLPGHGIGPEIGERAA